MTSLVHAVEVSQVADFPYRKEANLLCDEPGQSLVEFALTLPILLTVVLGMFVFGIAISNYILLTDATNVGGRQLSILRGNSSDPCTQVLSLVRSAAPTLTPSGTAGMSISITVAGSTYINSGCPGAAVNMKAGDPATVSITYPCSLQGYKINYVPNCSLKAQTTELIQ